MEDSGSKKKRGVVATAELQNLNKVFMRESKTRIWLTQRVHHTWKVLKGTKVFNSDFYFVAHLLSLEMALQ